MLLRMVDLYLFEYGIGFFDLVELNAELLYVHIYFLYWHVLVPDDGLEEHGHQPGWPASVGLVLVVIHALTHAPLEEHLDELLGELHLSWQLVEHLERVRAHLHSRQWIIVPGHLVGVGHADQQLVG